MLVLLAACGGGGGGGGGSGSASGGSSGGGTGGGTGGSTAVAPTLTGLTTTGGALSPLFPSVTLNYTVTLPFLVSSTTITPAAAAGTITVDGIVVASGASSQALTVDPGASRAVNVAISDGTLSTSYTVTVTRQDASAFAKQALAKASNADPSDDFGFSVGISSDGNTLAVGAYQEASSATGVGGAQADNTKARAGAVYVFARSGSTWSQQAYLKASNTDAEDAFGFNIALAADGNTLTVGAPGEASNAAGIPADNTKSGAGAVYVFTRSGTTWSQQAYVKASNPDSSDNFGLSVAISSDGNTMAVGALNEASAAVGIGGNQADNTKPGAGAVYVFTRSGATWSQQAYVKASNSDSNDFFGTSVALSSDGNTLSVGAYGESGGATGVNGSQADNTKAGAGAVYVFTRSGATWSQQAYVKASNTDAGDSFGIAHSLSSDGNTLAIGAGTEASGATGVGGLQSDNSKSGSGAVYVFTRNGTTWTQQAYVKSSNTDVNDFFGGSVGSVRLSADGNILAVGALAEAGGSTGVNGNQTDNSLAKSGAVYIYTRNGTIWTHRAYLKASNTANVNGKGFGNAVAMAADGTLVVGADTDDVSSSGINGAETASPPNVDYGSVYIYR